MNKLDKLRKKKQELEQRGRVVTEQRRAERLRKKINKKKDKIDKISKLDPASARRNIHEGLAMRKNPIGFMKDFYAAKKYKREKKEKKT